MGEGRERKRVCIRERGRIFSPTPLYLSDVLYIPFPNRSAVADPFVLACNPSAGTGVVQVSPGRLLSHDGRNTVGDKVEVTAAANSQKLFTKLLAGTQPRRAGNGGDANNLWPRVCTHIRTSRASPARALSSDGRYLVIPMPSR